MNMPRTALICVTPPENPLIATQDAKKHLRVEDDDDDDYIQSLVGAVTSKLDGGDGALKRALLTQTWKLVLPGFRHHRLLRGGGWDWTHTVFRQHGHDRRIMLPLPPTQSITGIQYIDTCGDQQTLDPALYKFVDCDTEPSFVQPAFGQDWPSTRHEPDAVQITFVAGYGDAAEDVPSAIIHAAKLWLGILYENRESALVADRAAAVALPNGVDDLLFNYKVLRL